MLKHVEVLMTDKPGTLMRRGWRNGTSVNLQADTRKIGHFETQVLLAIVRLKDNAYGASIQRDLEEHSGKEVCLGAVYVTLDRLERRGFVTSYRGEPTKVRGGCAKRMIQIEPKGMRTLESYKDLLLEIQETLDQIPVGVAVA
jgi:PadR family transcriptional regulator, regulatory protein PadR